MFHLNMLQSIGIFRKKFCKLNNMNASVFNQQYLMETTYLDWEMRFEEHAPESWTFTASP